MIITLCGSSAFREKKVALMEELEKLGHQVFIHRHYIEAVKEGRRDIMDQIDQGEHSALKIKYDYIKWYYDAICRSDAILVVNEEKNGIKGYIGGNVLLEIGFAYVNDKKIFLYNPIPELSYKDEIVAMQPTVINEDLSQIK